MGNSWIPGKMGKPEKYEKSAPYSSYFETWLRPYECTRSEIEKNKIAKKNAMSNVWTVDTLDKATYRFGQFDPCWVCQKYTSIYYCVGLELRSVSCGRRWPRCYGSSDWRGDTVSREFSMTVHYELGKKGAEFGKQSSKIGNLKSLYHR